MHAGNCLSEVQNIHALSLKIFRKIFFLQKTNCSSIGSPGDDEWISLKRAEYFAKTPTLFASKSKNTLVFLDGTFNCMRSLGKWNAVLASFPLKLCHNFACFSHNAQIFLTELLFWNYIFFPPEKSSGNLYCFDDKNAGKFLQKVSRHT